MVFASVAAAIVFMLCLSENTLSSKQEAGEDVDSVLSSSTTFQQYMKHLVCSDEDTEESDGPAASVPDCDDGANSIAKQRRHHSSALLKKEQKQSQASSATFIKVCIFCLNCCVNVVINQSINQSINLYLSRAI